MEDYKSDPKYVAARRAIIRQHHPDAGGSDAALITELRRLDQQWEIKFRIRRQVHNNLPPFVSEERADQAIDTVETVARRAGRFAGSVRHTLFERIPQEFKQGLRHDEDTK